ncbi:MAG: 5-formyltetrahydrofolate cyclo-ligase [Bacteroidota bacterium]
MTKQELRKTYLHRRLTLSEAEYLELSRGLSENFFANVDLSFVKVLHTFLPIEKNREPNTWLIIDRIRREFPNVRISIPKINTQTSILESYYFEGLHQLENNTWGIPEPKQGIPTPVEKIDAVIIPLLAFDRQGHRVGYGRGFYDKFLNSCRSDAKKIGVSFFDGVNKIDDATQTDVLLDQVVTPAELVTF